MRVANAEWQSNSVRTERKKMKVCHNTHSLFPKLLAALSLIAFISVGLVPSASSQSMHLFGEKVSRKLQHVSTETAGRNVHLIMQLNSAPTGQLNALLQRNGIHVRGNFSELGTIAVDIPAEVIDELAAFPEVNFLSEDTPVKASGYVTSTTGADAVRTQTTTSGGLLGTGLLSTTSTTTFDGTGVGIAVVDSGIDQSHTSFAGRVAYSKDFTGENRTDDPYGHGTNVAGLALGFNSLYGGIAPNAKLVNLRVLNSDGVGTSASLLSALNWILANRSTYNIRIVNLSLGTPAIDSYTNDPLCKAVRSLVDAGVVVLAAAGNNGKDDAGTKIYGQIHSPGNEPSAITIGASNTFGTTVRSDDGVTTYSSRGPTRSYWTDAGGLKHYDNLIKPDLVAPGNKIINALGDVSSTFSNRLVTDNPSLDAHVTTSENKRMMYLSGSSVSTPVVTGAVAMMLQANSRLTPNLIKMILMYTAQPLTGFNNLEQGAGQLNVEGALRLAKLVKTNLTNSTALGAALLTTSTPPTPQTTLSNYTFPWSQAIVTKYSMLSGTKLITKYQKVYGTGLLLSDGIIVTDGILISDGLLLSDGLLISDGILISDSTRWDGDPVFLPSGLLLSDGILLSDGTVLGDGLLLSDGILVADDDINADAQIQAQSAMINGDNTACMPAIPLSTR